MRNFINIDKYFNEYINNNLKIIVNKYGSGYKSFTINDLYEIFDSASSKNIIDLSTINDDSKIKDDSKINDDSNNQAPIINTCKCMARVADNNLLGNKQCSRNKKNGDFCGLHSNGKHERFGRIDEEPPKYFKNYKPTIKKKVEFEHQREHNPKPIPPQESDEQKNTIDKSQNTNLEVSYDNINKDSDDSDEDSFECDDICIDGIDYYIDQCSKRIFSSDEGNPFIGFLLDNGLICSQYNENYFLHNESKRIFSNKSGNDFIGILKDGNIIESE